MYRFCFLLCVFALGCTSDNARSLAESFASDSAGSQPSQLTDTFNGKEYSRTVGNETRTWTRQADGSYQFTGSRRN